MTTVYANSSGRPATIAHIAAARARTSGGEVHALAGVPSQRDG